MRFKNMIENALQIFSLLRKFLVTSNLFILKLIVKVCQNYFIEIAWMTQAKYCKFVMNRNKHLPHNYFYTHISRGKLSFCGLIKNRWNGSLK